MTKRDMTKKCLGVAALALALAVSVSRPAAAQDAKTVIANAAKAMGSENLTSISYYGSGANFGLGQSNNANGQWPRTNVSDYVRSIDFAQSTSRATGQTFAAPVTGGPAVANVVPAEHHAGQHRLGAAAGNLDHAVGISQRRRGQQRHREGPDDRRKAVHRRDLGHAAEGSVRHPVQGRRLHQRPEPGGEGRDLAGESDLRRHARRIALQRVPGRQRREIPCRDRAEARRHADVRSADPRHQRESPQHRAAGHASGPGGGRTGRRAGRRARRLPQVRPRRSSPTASTASTARTTRSPSSSPITSCSSSPARRTKRAPWRSSRKPRRSFRTSRFGTA